MPAAHRQGAKEKKEKAAPTTPAKTQKKPKNTELLSLIRIVYTFYVRGLYVSLAMYVQYILTARAQTYSRYT